MKVSCRVYEIERRVKTEDKYLFPCYETLHWYAAKAIAETVTGMFIKLLKLINYYFFSELCVKTVANNYECKAI